MKNRNFGKPLHEHTETEIEWLINNSDPKFGTLAITELNRRSQEKSIQQVDALTQNVSKLETILKSEADNSRIISLVAVGVAVLAVMAQLLFSIKNDLHCMIEPISDKPGFSNFIDCQRVFDFGLFGKAVFDEKSFIAPQREILPE